VPYQTVTVFAGRCYKLVGDHLSIRAGSIGRHGCIGRTSSALRPHLSPGRRIPTRYRSDRPRFGRLGQRGTCRGARLRQGK
jgi:hypothetical protein